MDNSEQKQYQFENGEICVHRIYSASKPMASLVKSCVIQAARGRGFLTGYARNDILQRSLGEPHGEGG